MANDLNLQELSISNLFNRDKCTFEIPIYQRNYAWEKDEIESLINDIYDAFEKESKVYYIGTLVSFRKDDNIFEVIDGQQRLTTIKILLIALKEINKGIPAQNKLTYRARKKSDKTLDFLSDPDNNPEPEEKDSGIVNGLKFAKEALDNIEKVKLSGFIKYFAENVHIIHYIVPRDIDLNHYFEVMNSRGEQLEKHEIIKARLMEKLNDDDKLVFNKIWIACSQMSIYIQDSLDFKTEEIFSSELNTFLPQRFESISNTTGETRTKPKSITTILKETSVSNPKEKEIPDSFQPIIDFPNFLLIVLKITRMSEDAFDPKDFILDDKELINEFKKKKNIDSEWVKVFAYTLLKSKFLLDNYIVHHSSEDETVESNPWQLQTYYKGEKKYLKNLCKEEDIQDKLVQLLSMFEVSFTAKQRKNYLFYCLYYLNTNDFKDTTKYAAFVENLANTYFDKVYLCQELLNDINTPRPGSFDQKILNGKELEVSSKPFEKSRNDFITVYGNGETKTKGIPLFIFNYMDFKIWKLYAGILRGEKFKPGDSEREIFFAKTLGCSDFGQKIFDDFYFSRTRRSLEHYFPQANINKYEGAPNESQINCFGNFAMISAQANSAGSNWDPVSKLQHYKKDMSGKINRISVASLKFWIMMQICNDNKDTKPGHEWEYNDIKKHQEKMLDILFES